MGLEGGSAAEDWFWLDRHDLISSLFPGLNYLNAIFIYFYTHVRI